MNGVEYYRIRRGLSRLELANMTEINLQTMNRYENSDNNYRGNGTVYLKLSDALGVPIDELVREDFPDIPDPTAVRKQRISRTANSENPITRYWEAHQLTFKQLAHRLGNTTKESGRKACRAKVPLAAHIEALSAYEGISIAEFYAKYSPRMEGSQCF